MFTFGFIRGAILGVSFGLMSGLKVKKIFKKKKKIRNSNNDKKES